MAEAGDVLGVVLPDVGREARHQRRQERREGHLVVNTGPPASAAEHNTWQVTSLFPPKINYATQLPVCSPLLAIQQAPCYLLQCTSGNAHRACLPPAAPHTPQQGAPERRAYSGLWRGARALQVAQRGDGRPDVQGVEHRQGDAHDRLRHLHAPREAQGGREQPVRRHVHARAQPGTALRRTQLGRHAVLQHLLRRPRANLQGFRVFRASGLAPPGAASSVATLAFSTCPRRPHAEYPHVLEFKGVAGSGSPPSQLSWLYVQGFTSPMHIASCVHLTAVLACSCAETCRPSLRARSARPPQHTFRSF